LAGNVTFYTWLLLGCPSAIGWQEELVAAVGRPITAVLRGKGRFAFVGMFPQVFLNVNRVVLLILENQGSVFLQNIGSHLPNSAISHTRRPESSVTLM
jgi:hypothetical protein